MCRRCSSRRRACSRRSSRRSSTTARRARASTSIQQLAASRPHLDRRRQGRSRTISIASPASASAASARCASTSWSGSPTSSGRRWPGAPGAPGPQPAAAADGFGFVVTTAMTSLAGCSGEDFASVLRALGYRMEKRPKPPPEPPPAETPAAEMRSPIEAAPLMRLTAEAVGRRCCACRAGTALEPPRRPKRR